MDADGVRKFLKIKLERERFGSQVEAAQAMGISDAHLAHVLNGRDVPGPKVLKWLGLKRVYYYEFDGLPRKQFASDLPMTVAEELRKSLIDKYK